MFTYRPSPPEPVVTLESLQLLVAVSVPHSQNCHHTVRVQSNGGISGVSPQDGV